MPSFLADPTDMPSTGGATLTFRQSVFLALFGYPGRCRS